MLMIFATFNDILHLRHLVNRVLIGQLFEGKGKVAAGASFAVPRKALYKARKLAQTNPSSPLRGRPHGYKKGALRMGLVCAGVAGTGRLLAGPRRDPCRHRDRRSWRRRRRGRAVRQFDRRRGQPPRRSRDHPLLFQARPRRPARPAPRSTKASRRSIATGLFQDVRISHAGGRLVVTVVENPVINRVAFEGNKKAKDEQLKAEVQSKPRGTLSRPTVQADVQRIIEIYHRSGRFDVQRRSEDHRTAEQSRRSRVRDQRRRRRPASRRSSSSATQPISTGRLKDVIKTSESNWLSFLQTTDIYDPDRIEADRDLLRRFYLKHGYADVRIVSAVGEYDPAKKGFVITFTIDEGAAVPRRHHRRRVERARDRSGVAAQQPQARRRRRLQRRGGREDRRGR